MPMPSPSRLSPDNILRFLQVRSDPASATEIAQGLHLKKTDHRPLFKILSKLKKRRAIEELPGGRYRLPTRKPEREAPAQKPPQDATMPLQPSALASRDEVKGRLVLHHDEASAEGWRGDRKSTRLNSSHQIISYAVFCLK